MLKKDIKNIVYLFYFILFGGFRSLIRKKEEITGVHSLSFRMFAPDGGKGGGAAVLSCQKILLGDIYQGYTKDYSLYYSFKEKENSFSLDRSNQLWDLFGAIKFVYKKCRKEYNAVYITHDYATAFALSLLRKKYVYIHHLQGSRVEEKLNFGEKVSFISKKIIQYSEKQAFKKSFFVSFPSNGAVNEFLNSKFTKVKKGDFTLGNVLFNTLYANPTPEEIPNLKKEDNILTFLSIGQLSYLKGMDRNIQLFEHLLESTDKNIRYILVGNGVLKDNIIESLTLLSNKYNNFSFVYFPSLSYKKILYVQNVADIYLMLHRKSIFDLSTLEAMSLKKVVILSNTGGNKDFNKNDNIIMLEEENYSKLVKDFLSADLKTFSLKNYYVYLSYFDKNNFIKNYHEIIHKLLSPMLPINNNDWWRFQNKILVSFIEEKDNRKIMDMLNNEDYFSKFFLKSKDTSRIDLIYIAWLIENNFIERAKKYIKKYIEITGTYEIHRLFSVANLAYKMGYEDEKIKQASEIFDYVNKSYNNNTLFNLLNNKSIAIVGNSDSSIGKNKGKEIDSHDIVIRFNNYTTDKFEKDYGSKCNIWTRGNAVDIPERKDEIFDLIIFGADFRYFLIHNDEVFDILCDLVKRKVSIYNCKFSDSLTKESNIKNPTTGLLVIWEIYKTIGLKNVEIYGFSFLKENFDKYALHYFNDRELSESIRRTINGRHDLILESEFLQLLTTKKE